LIISDVLTIHEGFMSSINNLLNSGYYQLGGSSSGANTAAANPASLAQAARPICSI
jgi:hypothetical protein